jgi:hypothetical protein
MTPAVKRSPPADAAEAACVDAVFSAWQAQPVGADASRRKQAAFLGHLAHRKRPELLEISCLLLGSCLDGTSERACGTLSSRLHRPHSLECQG